MTGDGTHTYQYDGEGRLKSIDNGATATSTFNALGLRVYRTTSGGSVSYWHDIFDQGIGGAFSGGGSNAFIPFGNRLLADYEGDGAHFAHANSLGSTTQTTDWTGGGVQEVTFYPWGRTWNQTSGYFVHQLFASLQDYDPDMDQYQTPNRTYPPILGRWMSPDPMGGDITNPQSLNRYAYVLNNPASFVDPTGLVRCEEFGEADCDCPPDAIDCCDPFSGDPDCPIGGGGPIGGSGGGGSISSTPPPTPNCNLYGDPMRCAGIDFPSDNSGGGGGPFLSGDYGPIQSSSCIQIGPLVISPTPQCLNQVLGSVVPGPLSLQHAADVKALRTLSQGILEVGHVLDRYVLMPGWLIFAGGAQVYGGVTVITIAGATGTDAIVFIPAAAVATSGAVMVYEGGYYLVKGRLDSRPYDWFARHVSAIVPK